MRALLLPLLLALAPRAARASAPRAAAAAGGAAQQQQERRWGARSCAQLLEDFHDFDQRKTAPYENGTLVYFLHLPRTAGRTLHACLLRRGMHPHNRCERSYDRLRAGGAPGCTLLSSHDDFSALQALARPAAVVTQLRDPLARFLSAYEFAATGAMRLVHRPPPRRGAAGKPPPGGRGPAGRPPPGERGAFTEEVWPWSHLVPFFAADVRARGRAMQREAAADKEGRWVAVTNRQGDKLYHNRARNETRRKLTDAQRARILGPLDPYANPLFMPLREFAAHPIAAELLHNGQALQVLGLTNYSHWDGAAGLRACAGTDQATAKALLKIAKARLRTLSHVGTAERLQDSVEACAASLGLDLGGAAYRLDKGGRPPGDGSGGGGDSSGDGSGGGGDDEGKGGSGGGEVAALSAAEEAEAGGSKAAAAAAGGKQGPAAEQGTVKILSRRAGARARTPYGPLSLEFSKAARAALPSDLTDEIRRLSWMDEELYALAGDLLTQRRADLARRKLLKPLPPPPPPGGAPGGRPGAAAGGQQRHERPGTEQARRRRRWQQQQQQKPQEQQQQEQQQGQRQAQQSGGAGDGKDEL
ncbi:MAG: hypothetical protein J3K34DRAFT_463899 [Monoraphidium minutum]|nr:MAG: hypothetical protein J3K34DRAFT_463899 [Monoraphidium minutum]